jgi:hypothetical protein
MRGLTRRRRTRESEDRFRERVQRDLEARGVTAEASRPVAARIAGRASELSGDAYTAFLDGVAAARSTGTPAEDPSSLEMQRLVHDFAIELKKLDEGLRLLSTYLLRIRDRARPERPRVVH